MENAFPTIIPAVLRLIHGDLSGQTVLLIIFVCSYKSCEKKDNTFNFYLKLLFHITSSCCCQKSVI